MTPVDFPAKLHAFTDNQSGIPTKRLLRTSATADEDDGERDQLSELKKIVDLAKSKFDASKVQIWLMKKKTGVDVLNKLELGGDAVAALKSSKMAILEKFFTKFNQMNPNNQISLIGTLTAHYGDDAVAKALVSTRKYGDGLAKDTAAKLSTQLLEGWLNSEKSVDDVFSLLKLYNDEYLALTS